MKRNGKPFTIDVVQRPQAYCHYGRPYVFLKPETHWAKITVVSEDNVEKKRRAVAHDLGHLLLYYECRGHAVTPPTKASGLHEDCCTLFDQELCRRLHWLYTKTPFAKHTQFPSLNEEIAQYDGPFRKEYTEITGLSEFIL